jgi:hypothetical protein
VKTRHRHLFVLVVLVCLIIAFAAWFIPWFWPQMCGNYRIDLYGRIVDEQGKGMPTVSVEAQLLYSDQFALSPFGREEKVRVVGAVSDERGNFHIGSVYGYAIDLRRISKNGKDLTSAVKQPSPDIGGRMDDRSQRSKMPNTPERRVTFIIQRQ